MTSRANRRRNRARARRRDDMHLQSLLERARHQVRDLRRRGSVYDLPAEIEDRDTRAALLGAIGAIVHEELLAPLTTASSRRRQRGRPAVFGGEATHVRSHEADDEHQSPIDEAHE